MRVISDETREKNRLRSAAWRKKHPTYQHEYDKKHYKRTNKRARIYAFRKKHPDYHRKAAKRYYHASPEKFRVRVRRRKWDRKELLGKIKVHYGCQNPGCQTVGILPRCCYEFHHVDRSKKAFEISSGCNHTWSSIQKEINKCTVLCANCHSQVHGNGLDARKFKKCKVDKDGNVIT